MEYIFDEEKSHWLKKARGVSFDDVINALENGKILDLKPHHNPLKYQNQDILIVEINQYAYVVPIVYENEFLILKTIYPSRKETVKYLKCNYKEENIHVYDQD